MAVHMKGLGLKSAIDFLKKSHGEDAYRRVVDAVLPETRAALEGDILVSSWYPLWACNDLTVTADQILGRGDLALIVEMGKNSARVGLEGVQKSFVKAQPDPLFVLKMGPLLWNQFYDAGRTTLETTGPERVVSRVLEFPEPHPAVCAAMKGWLEEATRIWGGGDPRARETRCRNRGDELCEFITTWTVEEPQ